MKKKYVLLIPLFLFFINMHQVYGQGIETFEAPLPIGALSWTNAGLTFSSSSHNFDTQNFDNAGAGGSNRYIDNVDAPATNSSYSILITGGATLFTMQSMEVYVSSAADGNTPTNDGTMTFKGLDGGSEVFSYTKTTGFPTTFGSTNGFFLLDFSALPIVGNVSEMNIDELEISISGAFQYLAVDNFEFDNEVQEADPPEIQSITVVGTPNSTATSVDFLVSFNENANNVSTDDFSVDATGGVTGSITAISGSGTTYTLTVSDISGEGNISIALNSGTNIEDDLGNSPAPAFMAGETHTVSRCFQETFENFTAGDFTWSSNGVSFTSNTANFDVDFFNNGGAGSSNQFLSNNADQGTSKVYSITTTGPELFNIEALDVYLSSELNGNNPTNDGTLILEGRLSGSTLYTIQKTTDFPTDFSINNGFYQIDFAAEGAEDYSLTNIDELRITLGGAFQYIALDNFEHCEEVTAATPPIVQSIKLIGNPPANSGSVSFEVIFNENAVNVTTDDFSLDLLDSATGTISGISGSGNSYIVSVNGISGEGSLRLDLNPGTDIEDTSGNTPPDHFTNGERFIASICNVETFETHAAGTFTWTTNTVPWSAGGSNFGVDEFIGAGASGSDRYLDNVTSQGTDDVNTISISDNQMVMMGSMEIYVSSELNGDNPTNDGTLTVRGKLDGVTVFTVIKSNGFPTTFGGTQGFYLWNFATEGGTDNSMTNIDEIELVLGGSFQYLAVDNFKFCINPPVTYTAPADLCIDAGVQTGLSGGSPIGGVYSGPGVTDDGNGTTYSFDPAAAGMGIHTLTYTTVGNSTMDNVEVFTLPIVSFTAPADLCIDAGVQTGLSGGSPTGGVYSGPGVIDDGNGTTYSFDPAAAGMGMHTITYTFTNTNGCTGSASDNVEVFSLPTVSFTAPADLCIDAGVQTGLSGGSPTGGVYSGPGITDDGNGTTYSFDPAAAGMGMHTITYTFTNTNGCTGSASDNVEVFSLPTVSFTAPADLCIDAGVQTGLSGGSPTGGVYSGPGITDDGNGTTYSFDPAAAGMGMHTITYTFTNTNGCTGSASDNVEVFSLPTVSFTAPADLCLDAGVQTGLSGGSPTGGVYSGPGVTDDGNGTTYSFDPAAAGMGMHTITYTFTNTNGCSGSASDNVEVFSLPTVSFTAPADLCIDAGVQTGLSGGSPTGGVYSGPGVTDDGNGTTYSFDPAAAGMGMHTITYTFTNTNGCSGSASDNVEVFSLPTVSFTAPADLCIDAGVQTGLSGGSPTGGVYSGPGVTDDGNGTTYSFDPAAAGMGMHTITYTFTNTNGCSGSASDNVEVFSLPTVSFTAPADLCIDAGVQTGLSGGSPTGGVYSGPGITDDGNGTTYSFDPAAAGMGMHTVTYTFTNTNGCTGSASDNVEVFSLPTVSFTAPADLCIDAGVQTGLSGGSPTGGVYSGPGVTDDGNGTTYSFDPAAAGMGMHTITYTFTNTNGCSGSASDNVEVFSLPTVSFTAPADLCIDAGVQTGLSGGSPTGGVYSGPGVTDDGNGTTYSFDPAAAGMGMHTITYTFTNTNGCSGSASDNVEVFSLPTISFTAPPSPVCPGDKLIGQRGGSPTGGVYSGPGVTDDGNGTTYTFDAASAGNGPHTLTYTYTNANGCTRSATDTVTVEDNELPTIDAPMSITVSANENNLYMIPDYFSEAIATVTDNCTTIVTIVSQSIAPGTELGIGTHYITLTAEDDNENSNNIMIELKIEASLSNTDLQLQNNLSMHPNPTSGDVQLNNAKLLDLDRLTIYDLMGRTIKTINLNGMGATKVISVQQLQAATYILIIKTKEGKQITKRLIKN